MRVSAIGLGITVEAQAGPTMPANVEAASNIITQQPYWNELISLVQTPLASASGPNIMSASSIASGLVSNYQSAAPATQQQILAQLEALWSILPAYLANAPIVDAWDAANNLGPGNYTLMGQTAQQALQSFFSAIGVTPATSESSGQTIPDSTYIVLAGLGLLVLWYFLK
jgi:hypothetical protein